MRLGNAFKKHFILDETQSRALNDIQGEIRSGNVHSEIVDDPNLGRLAIKAPKTSQISLNNCLDGSSAIKVNIICCFSLYIKAFH